MIAYDSPWPQPPPPALHGARGAPAGLSLTPWSSDFQDPHGDGYGYASLCAHVIWEWEWEWEWERVLKFGCVRRGSAE